MKVIRTLKGGYRQDADGAWWILNPSRGFVPVPPNARALHFALLNALAVRHKRYSFVFEGRTVRAWV
jgi:hypothetical protein